jgi:hypothetical protein
MTSGPSHPSGYKQRSSMIAANVAGGALGPCARLAKWRRALSRFSAFWSRSVLRSPPTARLRLAARRVSAQPSQRGRAASPRSPAIAVVTRAGLGAELHICARARTSRPQSYANSATLRTRRRRHSPPYSQRGQQPKPRRSLASNTSPTAAWRRTKCGRGLRCSSNLRSCRDDDRTAFPPAGVAGADAAEGIDLAFTVAGGVIGSLEMWRRAAFGPSCLFRAVIAVTAEVDHCE